MDAPAGWYDDPSAPNTRRYWDGQQWTEQRTEKVAPAPGFWTLTRAIAVGILIALACVVAFYSLVHSNDDLQCAGENADRAMNGEPQLDCD